MKRLISHFILVMLTCQLIVGPVFAQGTPRSFSRSFEGNSPSSGMSFRKSDAQDIMRMNGADSLDRDMKSKGMMITESAMSGLTYQVHVLGEVQSPGTYRITASDRLSEVLQRAGGVGDQGSERRIEVRRRGEGTKHVDLQAFQLFGELSDNPYLLDNDVVFVPLRSNTIQVVGAVMRPREYEITHEKTLDDAIKLAGDFSVGVARSTPIRVVRFLDGKKNVIEIEQNSTEQSSFLIQNGDVVFVPHVITEKNSFDYDVPKLPGDNIFYPSFEDRVFILGGVGAPQAYNFNPYYNITQYLSLAGGTTKLSTGKIFLIKPDGKKRRLKKKEIETTIINPGDTILVDERRIPPEGWVGIFLSIAGFGLSTTATVLTLTR